VVWFPWRTGSAQFDVKRSTYRGFRKTVSTVLLRNQVDAGCVKRSAAKCAQFIGQEHFLAANRIPLCRKNASSEDVHDWPHRSRRVSGFDILHADTGRYACPGRSRH
jgi:hypothetical protein